MNAAGKARQKWQARAITKFTKPGNRLLAEPCTCLMSKIANLQIILIMVSAKSLNILRCGCFVNLVLHCFLVALLAKCSKLPPRGPPAPLFDNSFKRQIIGVQRGPDATAAKSHNMQSPSISPFVSICGARLTPVNICLASL